MAVDDSFTVEEDGRVTIDVLSNDRDVDSARLSITAINGQEIREGSSVNIGTGTVTLSDGQLIYAPSSDVHGPASFTYTVSDGQLSKVATVNGTVTAVNDAPVAVDDSFTVEEDGRVTIDVLSNDRDVDSARLSITAINGQEIREAARSTSAPGR